MRYKINKRKNKFVISYVSRYGWRVLLKEIEPSLWVREIYDTKWAARRRIFWLEFVPTKIKILLVTLKRCIFG